MTDTLQYIDDYFNGLLQPEEKKLFEQRCEREESFAMEVAGYIASREAVRAELLAQKRAEWKKLTPVSVAPALQPGAKIFTMKRWLAVAAAACIIGILFLIITFAKNKPVELASDYISQNLQTLSNTMGGSKDSLQAAIDHYNKKEYGAARSIFWDIYQRDSSVTDALKYSGLADLMENKYREAIAEFETLAAKENLFANPGLFYKALTLLKRNTDADKATAKELLQQVVDKNLEGSTEAKKILSSW